jgi:hypothetical protein
LKKGEFQKNLVNRLPKDLIFERIGAHHAVDRFDCGTESLNRYLRESARRDQSSGIAAVFVLAAGGDVDWLLHVASARHRSAPNA